MRPSRSTTSKAKRPKTERFKMRTNNESLHERSIWQALSALPLQILSVTSLAVWLLFLLLITGNVDWGLNSVLFLLIPASYFFFSAYVSFRPPRKSILLITGIVANVPVTFIAVFAYSAAGPPFRELLLLISGICGAFLAAWSMFLVARLTTPGTVEPVKRYPAVTRNPDHHCLGSRFVEWHERHA